MQCVVVREAFSREFLQESNSSEEETVFQGTWFLANEHAKNMDSLLLQRCPDGG